MRLKIIGLIGLIGLIGPMGRAYAQDTNNLLFHIEGSTFFIDNEYFGDRVSGYTLPGFVLRPHVEWQPSQNVVINGGLHWLNYWGARDYPATTAYGVYPIYDSVSRPMHVLPWLQANFYFVPGMKFTLGSLDASSHDLPWPMYNQELMTVADPETGFQLTYENRWIDMDVWCDWREYIWDRSPVPERFTAGVSGKLSLDIDKSWWMIHLPIHFVVQHEGGQNMSVPHNINNNFNGSTGLGVSKLWKNYIWTSLCCRAMWYHQHGNDAVPFSNGWGIYPEFVLHSNHWSLMASYWYGKDFVPLLGSWHYSNLSANTPGLTFDRTRVVTLYADWNWSPNGYSHGCYLRFYGTSYHLLPSTGTFADGTTKDYGHRNQIAFGVKFQFYPTIRLH